MFNSTRIHFSRRAIVLAAILMATPSLRADWRDDWLRPRLVATNAEDAWKELEKYTQPPPSPDSWQITAPTPEQRQSYYRPLVAVGPDKAKDFYSRFPNNKHAADAKMLEYKFLLLATQWGETNLKPRRDAVERSMLKDPTITGEQHYVLLWIVAQKSPPTETRALLQEITNSAAAPANMKEAAARQLKEMAMLGKQIALQFTAVDGRAVDLAKLKGKVVLVDFWATWCGPCVGEVPNVKKTYDDYHAKGFDVVGISLDQDKGKLTQFTADHHMAWPQYFDGQGWKNKYARQFNINSIPTMWLIDKTGALRSVDGREDLSGQVQKMLAE